MLGVRLLVGAALFGVLLPAQPAQAADAVDFLDARPIVIDLDDVEPGQRWRVRLVDLQQGTSDVSLHVAFAPAGVITVQNPSVRSGGGGEVVEFVIELERRLEGAGELVAVGVSGATARRPIRTAFAPAADTVVVDNLQFAGWRIAPVLDDVRIPEVRVPDAPGSASTDQPLRVGVLTSTRGDVADLLRTNDGFMVDGVETVGEYTGGTDLLPGQDAGELQATVRVRDLPAWPLLVLVGGLTVANVLDRYQRRQRPQRLHEWRLARLREQAHQSQRLTGGRLRITAPRTSSAQLLLDHLLDDARAAFHLHLTDTERAAWEPGGGEYERLVATIREFRLRCLSYRNLLEERDSFIRSADQRDRSAIGDSLAASAVAYALRERSITSPAELTEAEHDLTLGRAHFRQFKAIYDRLRGVRRAGTADVGRMADRLLEKLFDPASDLVDLEAESHDLQRTSSRPPPLAKAPVGPWRDEERDRAEPPAGRAPVEAAPSVRGAPVRRALRAAAAAVALLSIGAVVFAVFQFAFDREPGPDGQAIPTQTASPPTSTPTAPLPDAPVAASTAGVALNSTAIDTPSTGQTVLFGAVAPALILLAVFGLAWLVIRWRRKRFRPRPGDLDSSTIDREFRREDRRFSALAGIVVVLSGMSLLYAGNPVFGTAGDYLAVALWGAAVGEGLQLARRLWPSLPISGGAS